MCAALSRTLIAIVPLLVAERRLAAQSNTQQLCHLHAHVVLAAIPRHDGELVDIVAIVNVRLEICAKTEDIAIST